MLRRFLILSGACFISLSAMSADIPTKQLTLRGVDKVTGHVKTFVSEVGKPVRFGALTILPEKCMARPPEETPENAAFLTITEPDENGALVPVFTGWMFSSNPALSAMEHPIYDVWVLNCVTDWNTLSQTAKSATVKELSAEELRVINEEDNPSLGDETPSETPSDER